MSWFGEQLSSFTEKITDFTKEVLIDDSATDKIDNSHENDTLSYKELLDLCKEKDLKINNLISEKASLENSIEELDQQHQEAIDALLLQKNQVISENNVLKEELANEKRKSFESSNGNLHALYTSSDLSCDIKNNVSEILCPELGDDINLISILQSVSDCSEDEKFKKQIDLLEKQKKLISNENKSNVNTDKIDNYINFLEALHSQSLYSVVDEICSIFNTLLSYNNQLRQTLKTTASAEDNGRQDLQIANKNTNCTCDCNIHYVTKFKLDSTASDSSIQNDLKVPVSDVSTQTDCNNFNSSHAEYVYLKTSKHSQTDDCAAEEQEHILLENNILIGQLKSSIQVLEEENLSLQENVCQLQSCLSKPKSNVLTQTDNDECDLAQEIVSIQEQSYITLQKKYSDDVKHLNEELQSRASLITALETEIQTLKTEISYLQEIIDDLKRNLFSKESEIADANAEMSALKNQILQQNSEVEKPLCSSPEIILLQEKLKSSELEKGKLLCVLNEKSQECSSLKSEVHKLTNIVASEKQALFKLQQDNCDLKHSSGDKSDPELTKEAIRKLSSLIKDKDLEIESLKQKNSTLTTLIQNVTSIPEHLQLLMEEKENLSKQVHQYNTERDKIMARFNAKDKECRERAAEMKKLNNQLAEKNKDFDILEQNYSSVIQQYEEKQKSLVNAQNEMVHLRQRTSELEQQLVDLKEKYSDLLNKINSEDTIQITKEELYDKDSRIEKLTCGNEEKDHLIQEKDCMIHDLSQQVKKFKLESEQQIHKIHEFEEKNSNLMDEIKETNASTELLQREKCLLEQRFQDRSSELDLLKEMNERLNMAVKEKEFAIQSMTEKISSLSQYISSGPSSPGTADVNQILADSESMFSEAQKFRRERDETLLALNQSKQENQSLRNEIQRMKSNEIHLESQLSRLREHLLEVEENYTNEALKAEEREKSLKDELVEVKRRADITSTAVVDTNQRASIQIASLQEQLSMVANQRDEALAQISSLEDKVLQHSTSVNKLQLVLEQMQKGNERKIKDIDNKWQVQLQKQKEAVSQLEKQLQIKQMQLEESSKALEAASRLSEQLDAKEEVISNLKKELSKFENQIRSTTQEIDSIKSNTEGKVDRVVMKSLVLGYFSTPPGQKSEVIRLLARVLDFNQEEMEKAGIVVGRSTRRQESRGIFSSIFNRLPSLSSPEQNQQQPEKSFTTLFVQFLENESQPIVHMPFPVEKMAQELTSKNHPNKKGQTTSNNSSPRRSPLLLDIDSAFPTFTPLPAVEYSSSPAPAILKEVLE